MSEELILNDIEENKEEYIEFLRMMVQADSYNPPGNEMNVVRVIDQYLKDSNITSEVYPDIGNNRGNLVAYLNENLQGKKLLYNGHIDTVPVGSEDDWKYPPLSATVKSNKMFGRGTTDMKGAVAAMIIALKILKKMDLKLSGNLIVNPVADEEAGGKFGTIWCRDNIFIKKKIKPDFIVVGEPSGFMSGFPKAIVVGEKGQLTIKLTTIGISGHSSAPFASKNAIAMMTQIVMKLDNLEHHIPKFKPPIPLKKLKQLMSAAFPSKARFESFLKEQPLVQGILGSLTQITKSITMIKGGIKDNVIPDKCEASINFRLLPNQKSEDVVNALRDLIEKEVGYEVREGLSGKPKDIYVTIEVVNQSDGSYWEDWEDSEAIEELKEVAEDVYKKESYVLLFPAGADSKHFRANNFCPETIVFGPGSALSAHAVNEHIGIKDYIDAIKVYTLFAYRFLK